MLNWFWVCFGFGLALVAFVDGFVSCCGFVVCLCFVICFDACLWIICVRIVVCVWFVQLLWCDVAWILILWFGVKC